MKADKLVSIVMPVHNTERYIKDTLESLKNQTYSYFEVILVDDCSDDNSVEIIRAEVESDERFRLYINEKREGAGPTRNKGLELANGDYLMFLDADDLFESDLVRELYYAIDRSEADVAICKFDSFTDIVVADGERNIDDIEEVDIYGEEGVKWITVVPWNKIFRKTFVEKNNLWFQDLRNTNDLYFVVVALLLAAKIVHVRTMDPLVHYRIETRNQISSDRDPFCAYEAYCEVVKKMQECEETRNYKELISHKFKGSVFHSLKHCKNQDRQKEFYNFLGSEEIQRFLDSLEMKESKYFLDWAFFEKIRMLPYETKWFETEGPMDLLLERNRDKIEQLLREYKDKKVYIWGAGNYGIKIARFCNRIQGGSISWFIDMDSSKHGQAVEGLKVLPLESLCGEEDGLIIASNRGIFRSIPDTKTGTGKFVVINLYEFMYGKSYEKCIKKVDNVSYLYQE